MFISTSKAKWRWKLSTQAIALFLSAGIVAQSAWSADGPGAAATSSDSRTASSQPSKKETSPSTNDFEQLKSLIEAQSQQLQQLNEALKQEQARTQALEDEINARNSAPASAAVVAAAATIPVAVTGPVVGVVPVVVSAASAPAPQQQSQSSAVQTPQDWSNRIGNLEQRLTTFGPFNFSGDFRLRDEPFFGGPTNQSLDQNRERFRLRWNVTAKLNDDFAGGFSLASGDINDPTSTNQTVSGFYTRKAIAIDKAYVNYTPTWFHPLTLTGGKFAYPWYNTELTWDKDLNPEGVAETLAWNLTSTPVLKKVALVGFQLPFAQVAATSGTNQSAKSSIVYGGQLQTSWQLAPRVKFGAYSGFYDWHNADPIALALAKANAKNPQTPLTGLLPLGTGNTVQNSIVTTTATNEVTVGGTSYAIGVTNITNAQFASKFSLFDSLARIDVTTPSAKWPVAFIGDYVQNMGACANQVNIAPTPANTTSIHYSQSTNFACNARERRGYWGEAQVGRAQKKGDWQFDYARIFIEREAVLSNFDYSDIRQGSNVTQHRLMAIYEVYPNVQLSVTALIGRPLNFDSTTPPQPWLQRYQFDVIYTF
jgi:hypothetical protein